MSYLLHCMDQDRIWIVAPSSKGGWCTYLVTRWTHRLEDDGGNGESLKILQNLFSYKISLFRISFDHTFNAIDFTHPDPDRPVNKTFFCKKIPFPLKAFDWELGKLQELAAESNWVLGEAEKMNSAFEMCELQKVELIPPWKIPSSVEPFPTNLSRWSTIASLSRALEELQSILWKATLHKRSVGGLKSKQGSGEEMRAVCSVKCEEHTEFERGVCKSVHQSNTNAIPMAHKRCGSNVRSKQNFGELFANTEVLVVFQYTCTLYVGMHVYHNVLLYSSAWAHTKHKYCNVSYNCAVWHTEFPPCALAVYIF